MADTKEKYSKTHSGHYDFYDEHIFKINKMEMKNLHQMKNFEMLSTKTLFSS